MTNVFYVSVTPNAIHYLKITKCDDAFEHQGYFDGHLMTIVTL